MTMHYYHFTNGKLRDGSPIPPVGEWLEFHGKLKPCPSREDLAAGFGGLHASEHPFDALFFAPGNNLHLVELGGEIIPHGDPVDKVVAQKRKIVATINAEKLCREFARRVARDVLHLWNAPEVVKRYLETGDESLRDAAMAAWAAAWDAAWAAARAARDAAWGAARAARDAAYSKYRQWFKEMVDAEFSQVLGGGGE